MVGLERLLEKQYDLERKYRGFLSSLDRTRIATLREVLTEPNRQRAQLHAEWIDSDLFMERFTSTAEFLDRVVPHERIPGYAGIPLVFLQRVEQEEDTREFRRRCCEEFSFFHDRFGDLPPQALYLHTQTNFLVTLEGTWRSRKRRMIPLNHFTSKGQSGIDRFGRTWGEKNGIFGFHVPSYPDVLKVHNSIATDYLARILIHDLGHGFFQEISPAYESVHNVTMLYAMGGKRSVKRSVNSSDPWETLIQAECSDPFFFFEAEKYLANLRREELSPVQRRLVKKLYEWYVAGCLGNKKLRSTRSEQREKLWGINGNCDLAEAKKQVIGKIEEMLRTGFPLYR